MNFNKFLRFRHYYPNFSKFSQNLYPGFNNLAYAPFIFNFSYVYITYCRFVLFVCRISKLYLYAKISFAIKFDMDIYLHSMDGHLLRIGSRASITTKLRTCYPQVIHNKCVYLKKVILGACKCIPIRHKSKYNSKI